MKQHRILVSMFALMALAFTLGNCSDDEETKSCSETEICTGKSVTSCCDDGVCVFTYNDKEYAEEEEDQLAADLGCTSPEPGGGRISTDNEQIIARLRALMEEARAGLR